MEVKTETNEAAVDFDQEWDNVTQTIMMLGLSVGQIESSMRDGDESVNELASSFTAMYGEIQKVAKAAAPLANIKEADSSYQQITQSCETISEGMQRVIIAMQFYDKLSQRLSHVSSSTLALAELLADSARPHQQSAWNELQEKILSLYTLNEERLMFEAITKGASIEDALIAYRERTQREDSENDIELF